MFDLVYRCITVLLIGSISLAILASPGAAAVQSTDIAKADLDLVEHSGEIFIGRIDIVTYVANAKSPGDGPDCVTGYTVLISETFKGKLQPQSIIVVEQAGCVTESVWSFAGADGPMAPGEDYLLFVRFVPGQAAYQITEPVAGNIQITSPEQRTEFITYWSNAVDVTWCPHTDVLKLGNVLYARRDWNEDKRYLEREWVGPTVARVESQDTTATGCRVDLTDRTSSTIPVGAKIQELKGYATTFRVAVRMPDKHRYLYEAIWSENAKTGADLLDIRGRVVEIEYARNSFCNDRGCVDYATSRTGNADRVRRMTEQILGAPIANDWAGLTRHKEDETGHIRFVLDDGSTAALTFQIESGQTTNGIQLPTSLLTDLMRGYDTPEGF